MSGPAWYPGARKYALSRFNGRPAISPGPCIILHTAVGGMSGQAMGDWQNGGGGSGGTLSHFYVDKPGCTDILWQYGPLTTKSACSKSGDAFAWSVESWDTGQSPIPAWSDDQCEAIVGLLAWLHAEWGLQLVPYQGTGSKGPGVAYHSLPARQPRAWATPPGPASGPNPWTSSAGKVCPDTARIQQIPGLISAASGSSSLRPDSATQQEVDVPIFCNLDTGQTLLVMSGVLSIGSENDRKELKAALEAAYKGDWSRIAKVGGGTAKQLAGMAGEA